MPARPGPPARPLLQPLGIVMATKDGDGRKVIARNRKARHEYHILEDFEAGIVLHGSEVKSLREGRCNLNDAFGSIEDGELYLRNLHISPYENASHFNHEATRKRKLLVHSRELQRLIGKTAEKGMTLVALEMYFRGGWAKVQLGVAKGKKLHDKRHATAERDAQRRMQQAMRGGAKRRGSE